MRPKCSPALACRRARRRRSYEETIREKLGLGLTAQRIWQDLVEDFGYGYSYESVKRYVRRLEPERRAVGVMHEPARGGSAGGLLPGAADAGRRSGQWRRPWVFRMTLCHSRHGYEEAVWDQKLESFLALHERAFRDLGGVPRVVRHDNLKAAVVRACLYDPDVNPVYDAFAKHWGFTALPTRPRNPKENGKQERSGGYVKDNALKGRRFDSLDEHERVPASLEPHGGAGADPRHDAAPGLHPLRGDRQEGAPAPGVASPSPSSSAGTRTVHSDGHVEVERRLLSGAPASARAWTCRCGGTLTWSASFTGGRGRRPRPRPRRVSSLPGRVAPRGPAPASAPTSRSCSRSARVWGPSSPRGPRPPTPSAAIRALRLIQGALALVRKHPKEAVLSAAKTCLAHRLFRYRDLRRLTEMAERAAPERRLTRRPRRASGPIHQYRLEVL